MLVRDMTSSHAIVLDAARRLHAEGIFVTLTNLQRKTNLSKGVIGEALRALHESGYLSRRPGVGTPCYRPVETTVEFWVRDDGVKVCRAMPCEGYGWGSIDPSWRVELDA
jgi:hypothetical protein